VFKFSFLVLVDIPILPSPYGRDSIIGIVIRCGLQGPASKPR